VNKKKNCNWLASFDNIPECKIYHFQWPDFDGRGNRQFCPYLDNKDIQSIRDYSGPLYLCQGRGEVSSPASFWRILGQPPGQLHFFLFTWPPFFLLSDFIQQYFFLLQNVCIWQDNCYIVFNLKVNPAIYKTRIAALAILYNYWP